MNHADVKVHSWFTYSVSINPVIPVHQTLSLPTLVPGCEDHVFDMATTSTSGLQCHSGAVIDSRHSTTASLDVVVEASTHTPLLESTKVPLYRQSSMASDLSLPPDVVACTQRSEPVSRDTTDSAAGSSIGAGRLFQEVGERLVLDLCQTGNYPTPCSTDGDAQLTQTSLQVVSSLARTLESPRTRSAGMYMFMYNRLTHFPPLLSSR